MKKIILIGMLIVVTIATCGCGHMFATKTTIVEHSSSDPNHVTTTTIIEDTLTEEILYERIITEEVEP